MSQLSQNDSTRWRNDIHKILSYAFEPHLSTDTSSVETSKWVPAVDVQEDKSQFTITADLPGVDKNDISISMENNTLIIRGMRKHEAKEEKSNYYRIERIRGSFYRQFTLPDTADGSNIKAKMQRGVLEIHIPKKDEAQPRSIEIEDND